MPGRCEKIYLGVGEQEKEGRALDCDVVLGEEREGRKIERFSDSSTVPRRFSQADGEPLSRVTHWKSPISHQN